MASFCWASRASGGGSDCLESPLTQPTWRDFLRENGHNLPPLALSSWGAPCLGCTCTPYSTCLPASGLTQTPVWDSSPAPVPYTGLSSAQERRDCPGKGATLSVASLVRDKGVVFCLPRSLKPQLCWSPETAATPRLPWKGAPASVLPRLEGRA